MKARAAAILRHRPLFAVALVAVVCVAAANVSVVPGLAAVLACGLSGWFLGGWRWAGVAGICGLLAVGIFTGRVRAAESAEKRLLVAGGGVCEARLLEDATGRNGFWSARAVLRDGPGAGARIFWESRGEPPVAGAVVRGPGNFELLPVRRNPGEFDKAAWLRSRGVVVVFRGIGEGKVETGKWARTAARLKQGFRTAVTTGLEPESRQARVILAVVVGQRPVDSEEVIEAFLHSGALHVFSVSGLHVALVGSIGWLVLRALGVPRRVAVLFLIPLAFGYSWITGNSPPAVRAAWMMAVFLSAFAIRRPPDLLNILGAVMLGAMLWDGRLLFQAGVQLSYGVVTAIGIGTEWASRRLDWVSRAEEYLPFDMRSFGQRIWLKLRKWLAGMLSVSTAAGVGATPLTAFHFGLVTPVSIPASLVLVPLTGYMLGCALFAAMLYPVFPGGARMVNRCNGRLSDASVWSAEVFAAVPGGHFLTRSTPEPFLLVYDLDFGAGAACFSAGREGAVLIDCGDAFAFKHRILPSLRELGVRPDSVVLSHPDGGHMGGGSPVWESLPVKQVLLPVDRARSPAFRAWAEEAPLAGVRTVLPREGQVFPMPGGARLEVLHVPDPLALHAAADDRVVVLRLHWEGWKILFTSDSGTKTENELLAAGKDLSADVIVAGRHCRDFVLCDRFLDAVSPRAIIASNSPFPQEERLPQRQADYWKSLGIHVLDLSRTGGVTVRITGDGGLAIDGFMDGSSLRLKHPPEDAGIAAATSVSPGFPTTSENPSSDKKTSPLPTPSGQIPETHPPAPPPSGSIPRDPS